MNINNTIDIDHPSGQTTITCEPNTETLTALLAEQLAGYQSPVVLVSGGLDSQLAANLVKLYTTAPSAVIYDLIWQDNTINCTDVVMAQKFCKLIDLEYRVISVDITEFLEKHLTDFARKYKVISPQVASLMYAIQQSDFPEHTELFMGGEAPLITLDENDAPCLDILRSDKKLQDASFYMRYYAPFALLSQELGISITRDIGSLSPKIYYQFVRHNIDVIQQFNEICKASNTGLKNDVWRYKVRYYEHFGHQLIRPLSKATGFESIQRHLASMTGVHDQFNRSYRNSLESLCKTEKWFSATSRHDIQCIGGGVELVLDQATELLSDLEVTVTNTYKITW